MCLIYTHSVVAVYARHNEVCGGFCGLRFVWMLVFSLFIQGSFLWILRILCESKTNESVSMCKWSLCGHQVLGMFSHTEFTEFADSHFCSCNCLSFRLSRNFSVNPVCSVWGRTFSGGVAWCLSRWFVCVSCSVFVCFLPLSQGRVPQGGEGCGKTACYSGD